MKLIGIKEDAITVDLNWIDVRLLTYVCEYAKQYDVLGNASDWNMAMGYLEATVAFLYAAGMASWAQTVTPEEYTFDTFREMVPITSAERAAEEARRREGREQRPAVPAKGAA